jgi:hypothetical protein
VVRPGIVLFSGRPTNLLPGALSREAVPPPAVLPAAPSFFGSAAGSAARKGGRPALLALALALLAVAGGCAKPPIAGYEPQGTAPPELAHRDPGSLPAGWGYVDVTCRQGQSDGRGTPDTLFGCLLHARDQGEGTVHLPHGVYLGHVAGFISQALKYYHVEKNFQQL